MGLNHGIPDRGVEGDIAEICKNGRRKGLERCGTVEEAEGCRFQDRDEVGFQCCFWEFEA